MMQRPLLALAAALSFGSITSTSHAQPCEPDWLPTFGGNDLYGPVRALTTFDPDADGPQPTSLYAFQCPSTFASPRRPVQRWTGSSWSPVGGSELNATGAGLLSQGGGPGARAAFAVYDPDEDGPEPASLYVCGPIRFAPTGAYGLARLNGNVWELVGNQNFGFSSRFYDLQVFDEDADGPIHPALFAAGQQQGEFNLFRWDGSTLTVVPFPSFGTIFDLAVGDLDGDGPLPPRLYAAGAFQPDDVGQSISYLAEWDGVEWHSIGAGLPFRPGPGVGIAFFDEDGPGPQQNKLFVTSWYNYTDSFGSEDQPGGLTSWDGAAWTRIIDEPIPQSGTPPAPQQGRMVVHDDDGPGPLDPALYVCAVPNSGDVLWRSVSRWDGVNLSPLGYSGPAVGGTVNGSPYTGPWCDTLTTFDPDAEGPLAPMLVVGGGFTATVDAPIIPCGGGGVVLPNQLAANFVAMWNGELWSPFSRGLSWSWVVFARSRGLAVLDPDQSGPEPESLFVHGEFSTAGSVIIPLRLQCGYNNPLQVYNTEPLRNANARWSATAGWHRAGLDPDYDERTTPRRIHATARFDPAGAPPETTFVGGSFTQIENDTVSALAMWVAAATAWTQLGAVAGPAVHAIEPTTFNDARGESTDLYIAGEFTGISDTATSAAGAAVRWNSGGFSSVGASPPTGTVRALTVFDPDADGPFPSSLIAAGDFTANASTTTDIASFNGSDWLSLGDGALEGTAETLEGLASGPPVPTTVYALALFDADGFQPAPPFLCVAGNFTQWRSTDGATTIPLTGIAKWDGQSWSSLGPPLFPAQDDASSYLYGPYVRSLAVLDPDAAGPMIPQLFAGGAFVPISGSLRSSRGIGRFDGEQWWSLGNGLSTAPFRFVGLPALANDLRVFDDDAEGPHPPALFVAGFFLSAGGRASWSIAKWGCEFSPPPPCQGDANADGTVNFADITEVLTYWLTTYPGTLGPGDANHDGTVNFADITTILKNFNTSCP